MTTTTLELSFTPKQIAYLAHTSCGSFVLDQPGRFFTFHSYGPTFRALDVFNEEEMGSGWLHWMDNDLYLSALIMQRFCIARGYQAAILTDGDNEDKHEWVVWTTDPLGEYTLECDDERRLETGVKND